MPIDMNGAHFDRALDAPDSPANELGICPIVPGELKCESVEISSSEPQAEEYVSQSSIDNPPVAEVEPKQDEEDFKKPRPSDLYRGERLFEVEFSVVLKPVDGKPIKVPLFADTVRGTLVEECLRMALADARNETIIQAVLDNPKDRVRVADAANVVTPTQGGLF